MDIGSAPEIISGLEITNAFGTQRHPFGEKKEGEKQKGGQQGEQLKGGPNLTRLRDILGKIAHIVE